MGVKKNRNFADVTDGTQWKARYNYFSFLSEEKRLIAVLQSANY